MIPSLDIFSELIICESVKRKFALHIKVNKYMRNTANELLKKKKIV